jgi:hypothetical protein
MSELQSLLLVLAAIYAVECLVWVPLGAIAFSSLRGRVWRWHQPGLATGNARGGFLLADPLPPLGTIIYGLQLPLSLSPDGVCAWNPACLNGTRRTPQCGAWMRWAEVREVATLGRKVFLNGQFFLKANSEGHAVFLAGVVRRIHRQPPEQRVQAITTEFAAHLDTHAVSARRQEAGRRAGGLQWLANLLLLTVFAATPLLAWHYGWRRFLWALVGVVLAQTVTAAVLYYRAHKALLPAATEERFTWCLTMLLAAPTAMRAHDLLVRHAFEQFHPLALARVLVPADAFRELAQQAVLDARHPLEPAWPGGSLEARTAVTWSHAAWREALEVFVGRTGLSLEQLVAPPTPSEPCHVSYCPRCRTQFVLSEGRCPDCGGLALERLGAADRAATRQA